MEFLFVLMVKPEKRNGFLGIETSHRNVKMECDELPRGTLSQRQFAAGRVSLLQREDLRGLEGDKRPRLPTRRCESSP
jgi:hypothetical protein